MMITIDFPGGSKVDAHFDGFTVKTDQPSGSGGEGTAPTPFAMFLASIGTCAGIYALGFCRQRGLATDGLQIIQSAESNPATGMIELVDLDIELPRNFPEKYREAIIHAVELCAVKKHINQPPRFEISTREFTPAQ
jgi:ribosomal protein S12 methylthiotransferase accessory factor